MDDPISLHTYAYARNNAANFVDPSGKFFNVGLGLVGAAIGAGVAGLEAVAECDAGTGSCDTGKITDAVAIGGATGFAAGFTLGLSTLGWVGVGAGSAALGNAANQFVQTGSVDFVSVGIAAASGAIGGKFGQWIVGNGVSRLVSRLPAIGPAIGEAISTLATLEAAGIAGSLDVMGQAGYSYWKRDMLSSGRGGAQAGYDAPVPSSGTGGIK